MKKIRETITALTSGESVGAVHINRKEHNPMSDERFRFIGKCITIISVSIAGTVAVSSIDWKKLLILSIAGLFLTLIYFALKD